MLCVEFQGITYWCSGCWAQVDSSGGTCPDCFGPVSVEESVRERRTMPARVRPLPGHAGHTDLIVTKRTDPLFKVCKRCKTKKTHKARSGTTTKPQAYCPPCIRAYGKEQRQKNWQREKARNTWKGMVARCHNTQQGVGEPDGVPKYRDYGAKGVEVAECWRDDFQKFWEDLGPPPHPKFTLDRLDPHKHYEPGNVAWVHPVTQRANRKNSRWIEAVNPQSLEKEIHTMADWRRICGWKAGRLRGRLNRGWDTQRAVSQDFVFRDEVPF